MNKTVNASPASESAAVQLVDEPSRNQPDVHDSTQNDRALPLNIINESQLRQLLGKPQSGRHPGFDAFNKASLAYTRLLGRFTGTVLSDKAVQQLIPAMVVYLREHQTSRLTDEQVFFQLADFLNHKVQTIRASPAQHLKIQLLQMSPHQFEIFTRDLIQSLGVTIDPHIGVKQSVDGGIDGFGYYRTGYLRTERIAIQAKRWRGNIGSRDIDAFRGAIDKFHADFGIFITTSRFTREAVRSSRVGVKPITLIDGEALVEIVIKRGVAEVLGDVG